MNLLESLNPVGFIINFVLFRELVPEFQLSPARPGSFKASTKKVILVIQEKTSYRFTRPSDVFDASVAFDLVGR